MGKSDVSTEEQLREFWENQGDSVGVPEGVRELLNTAFSNVPVSSFPKLACGKGIDKSSL